MIAVLCAMVAICAKTSAEDGKKKSDSDAARDVVELKGSDVSESSGLAVSYRDNKRWWTHNDSGGKSQVFAFNHKGKRTGKCDLEDVKAKDWEDMASFEIDGQPKLIVADCGDNLAKRRSIWLYVFDEPDPNESTDVDRIQKIQVSYPNGSRDCEAIAFDKSTKQIVLIEKSTLPFAGIYAIDLPPPSRRPTDVEVVATRIGTLNIPLITAADIDPINGDLWVVNYFQAFRFPRTNDRKDLTTQITALPKVVELPKWKQIEAAAVDRKHQLWLTSEGKDAPLGRLNLNHE